MALKFRTTSLDDVPEALRPLYVADGEQFRLDIEDMPDPNPALAQALASERKQVREGRGKVKSIEDQLAALQAENEELKSRQSEPADDGTKAELRKVKGDLERVSKEMTSWRQAAEAREERLRTSAIERALEEAAVEARVQPQYFDDVKLRANKFTVLDEQVVMVDAKGEPQLNEAGTAYITPKEFVLGLTKSDKVGWVAPSAGGGARGTGTAIAGRAVISRDDSEAFLANLDSIAKGKTAVQ